MKFVNSIIKFWKVIVEIFDDWLTRLAAISCLLIIVLVITNMRPVVAEKYPLLGTMLFGLVPVLFIIGGVIFIMAILKFSERGDDHEPS